MGQSPRSPAGARAGAFAPVFEIASSAAARSVRQATARPAERCLAVAGTLETARYFDCADGQIYTVTHSAALPRRGAVLLCGPFGVERERSYLPLVLWARTLAARGFDVMRFDYRGHGESSGHFEDMTVGRWREDAAFCAARLSAATPGCALILQGVRLGALIAAELFASGQGDGLLLWEAPATAEALLRETLRHNLVSRSTADRDAELVVREQLIAALEAGEPVNVDGYFWTKALWREAQRHPLCLPAQGETRPWHAMQAQGGAPRESNPVRVTRPEAVDADTFWKSSSTLLVPRSEGFFQASLRWLDLHEPWNSRGA